MYISSELPSLIAPKVCW